MVVPLVPGEPDLVSAPEIGSPSDAVAPASVDTALSPAKVELLSTPASPELIDVLREGDGKLVIKSEPLILVTCDEAFKDTLAPCDIGPDTGAEVAEVVLVEPVEAKPVLGELRSEVPSVLLKEFV